MQITIPKLSLVVLIGPSGSGKSTFAKKHFLATEVLSSDYCRGLVSDDENDQKATKEAFEVLHFIARKRLAAGKLTVVDATNVQPESRKGLVAIAREFHCLPVAIVFDLPAQLCEVRNKGRADRTFGGHVIAQQCSQMRRALSGLKYEGFRHIFKLQSEEQVNAVVMDRTKLWNDKTEEQGPFDIIGDVHGCGDELEELLGKLGYEKKGIAEGHMSAPLYVHPQGRKAIFVGDLVDRGPRCLDVVKIVYHMVKNGHALCVPGNHDMKFMRKLRGKDVQITHGLAQTMAEVDALPAEHKEQFCKEAMDFLDDLVSHYVLDGGKLVVAHAGLKQEMQGRGSGQVRDFCLYGETTGESDEFGLPVRYNWAAEYRGPATVVYGHTPVLEPEWLNRTVNIDTGCVFGGKLTALRYPEKEFISVEAKKVYVEHVKPIGYDTTNKPGLTQQQQQDDLLDAEDVLGKRIVSTRLSANVTIREENAIAALEIMSRFAINPKWLIYLPPTMSPSETSEKENYLEYPSEAFAYFRKNAVPKVICEEKHMGSRAVVIVCKDETVALKRFGIVEKALGCIYTRTGRRFFDNEALESGLLERTRKALDKTNFWSEFKTDWVCLDCELMPWSAKAIELLKRQYAAVGSSARAALDLSVKELTKAAGRSDMKREGQCIKSSSSEIENIDVVLDKMTTRKGLVDQFIQAYRHYCWDVKGVNDLKLAPFHMLATEGKVYFDKTHQWHMETLAKICNEDSQVLLATPFKIIDVTNPEEEQKGVEWWEALTSQGGEGMVIKPLDFVVRGHRGLVQPALKCRGQEYLRIIYGPEYSILENLKRLRSRNLGGKRSLAQREFALGVESLERFIRHEPLRRVHECVFGVLALESEPVDPRL